MGNKLNYFKIHALDLLTDEGPEPQRREVKKRAAAPRPGENPVGADSPTRELRPRGCYCRGGGPCPASC